MNEKDPDERLSLSPVLSPETIASKRVEPEVLSEEPEQAVSKSNRGTKILIGSLATLLLAGGVTIAILAGTGAFSKAKKVTDEETSAASVSQTKAETDDTSAATEETTTGTTATAAPMGRRQTVTALSEVSDDQFKVLDETSRKLVRDDGNFEGDGIPDNVNIDNMNYLGMVLMRDEMSSNETSEQDVISMIYQVLVTDNTGAEPVKRQFFWMMIYQGVYKDGTIDPSFISGMRATLCFDNWSTHGSLDLDSLMRETQFPYSYKDKTLDESKILPFEGETVEKLSVIKSLDKITKPMEEGLKKGAEDWQILEHIMVGAQTKSLKLEKIEYAGMALANSKYHNENRVYVIYKLDITDLDENPPASKSAYWYISFGEVYEGGQIQTSFINEQNLDASNVLEMVNNLSTLEDLRYYIQTYEKIGWDYEDNLEGELYSTKKAETETTTETTTETEKNDG